MKNLKFANQEFKADKIIKTESEIIGKDVNDVEVFRFNGISNFAGFILEEGQNFDNEQPTTEELLTKEIAILKIQIMQLKGGNA